MQGTITDGIIQSLDFGMSTYQHQEQGNHSTGRGVDDNHRALGRGVDEVGSRLWTQLVRCQHHLHGVCRPADTRLSGTGTGRQQVDIRDVSSMR